jgi:hypothetical protein
VGEDLLGGSGARFLGRCAGFSSCTGGGGLSFFGGGDRGLGGSPGVEGMGVAGVGGLNGVAGGAFGCGISQGMSFLPSSDITRGTDFFPSA